ncbi:MAG: hypothetical protein ABMA64_10760 [Myxococcota bacterium]
MVVGFLLVIWGALALLGMLERSDYLRRVRQALAEADRRARAGSAEHTALVAEVLDELDPEGAATRIASASTPFRPSEADDARGRLDRAVTAFRKAAVAEALADRRAFDPTARPDLGVLGDLRGESGFAQGTVAGALAGESIVFHRTGDHAWLVVVLDGSVWMVDPAASEWCGGPVGASFASTRAGRAVLTALVTDGYVELTPEVAAVVGQAVEGVPWTVDRALIPSVTEPHVGLDVPIDPETEALFGGLSAK